MKTFNDLEFNQHPLGGGIQALIFFPNGYGASVVGGSRGLYGDGVKTFELAVLYGTKDDWALSYSTEIADDVLGWQSKDDVTEILRQIQELQP
jgi:hypothetical protein